MRHGFSLFILVGLGCSVAMAQPVRKLLVVTTTLEFRHSSIPTAEKVLDQLARETGRFTIDLVQQPAGKPNPPSKPRETSAEEGHERELADYRMALKSWEEAALKETLSRLSSLKNYDGVVFVSTTGELPISDRNGFLEWIRSGHAFIGIHAASDTFHGWPEYIEMLGGEFESHKEQVPVECLNQDLEHPATRHLGTTWKIPIEEIYRFKNYKPSRVRELLVLDRDPNDGTSGHFPISWCREYGKGRVFYTALGHREDLWDDDETLKDRQNPTAVSKAFQQHVLGGVEWALGIGGNLSAPPRR